MTTKSHYSIEVSGIRIQIVRKNIKNMHLGVYPPDGRVRVSAPLHVSDETICQMIITRLQWIRRHQDKFANQQRQSEREMVTGESHYVAGKSYLLDVIEHNAPAAVCMRNNTTLELRVRPGTDRDRREAILHGWYRQQLRERVPELIAKWEPVIGVSVAEWHIKRMKTRWGTCNIQARRIWINLELAKKPLQCLEYIIVHEMVHLLERHHNARFKAYMDSFLPHWRLSRDMLNEIPLAHEEWTNDGVTR